MCEVVGENHRQVRLVEGALGPFHSGRQPSQSFLLGAGPHRGETSGTGIQIGQERDNRDKGRVQVEVEVRREASELQQVQGHGFNPL